MKNLIKTAIKEFKEGFGIGYINSYAKITGHGIPVVLSDETVHNNSCIYAVCVQYTSGKYVIYVDNNYMSMPKRVQEFIIWHELGHIHEDGVVRTLECECRADAYAAKKVGKRNAIYALNYMWSELGTIDWRACADIPSRAKALGANVDGMYLVLPNGITLYEPQLRYFINKEM